MFGVLMKKANVDTDTDPLAKGECRGKIGYRYEAGNVTEPAEPTKRQERIPIQVSKGTWHYDPLILDFCPPEA